MINCRTTLSRFGLTNLVHCRQVLRLQADEPATAGKGKRPDIFSGRDRDGSRPGRRKEDPVKRVGIGTF